jgi:hypothetical protein
LRQISVLEVSISLRWIKTYRRQILILFHILELRWME